MKTLAVTSAVAGLVLLCGGPASAQYREAVAVNDSREVLTEIMAIPANGIPASLLADAQGIVIVPDLVKGGFVVGARYGRGIAMVRDARGFWRPPAFVTLAGGSVGWQIGLQVTDIILVFKTRSSVDNLMRGKFTLGADAAAAAGPVGREAAAATDATLRAEIYTYSRSRGLFAGVSLDGSVLQIDHTANAAFYQGANVTDPAQSIPVPASAIALMRTVGYYTGTPGESLQPNGAVPPPAGQPTPAVPGIPTPAGVGPAAVGVPTPAAPTPAELQAMRQQLSAASLRLHTILDASWRNYLILPAEVYAGDRPPSAASLRQSLSRFDGVARDPRFGVLAQRVEFRAAHDLLQRYTAAAAASPTDTARNAPASALPPK
jgi:lipid-binding SYLF domain-containing protein